MNQHITGSRINTTIKNRFGGIYLDIETKTNTDTNCSTGGIGFGNGGR